MDKKGNTEERGGYIKIHRSNKEGFRKWNVFSKNGGKRRKEDKEKSRENKEKN